VLESSLIRFLRDDDPVFAIVEGRITAVLQHQKQKFPSISVQRVHGQHHNNLTGPSGLVEALIQIDCWGKVYNNAKLLAEAVRIAMLDFSGTQFGTNGIQSDLESDRDLPDPTTGIYRVMLEYRIFYQEATS